MSDYEEAPPAKRPRLEPAPEPKVRNGKLIDDPLHGDSVNETTWLERRKEPAGWRNGARVRKIESPK